MRLLVLCEWQLAVISLQAAEELKLQVFVEFNARDALVVFVLPYFPLLRLDLFDIGNR